MVGCITVTYQVKVTHLRTYPKLWWYASLGQILCKSVKEILSYRANNILHCDLEMQIKGRSRSLIFKHIQGYGGMHHWVKFCVNR